MAGATGRSVGASEWATAAALDGAVLTSGAALAEGTRGGGGMFGGGRLVVGGGRKVSGTGVDKKGFFFLASAFFGKALDAGAGPVGAVDGRGRADGRALGDGLSGSW